MTPPARLLLQLVSSCFGFDVTRPVPAAVVVVLFLLQLLTVQGGIVLSLLVQIRACNSLLHYLTCHFSVVEFVSSVVLCCNAFNMKCIHFFNICEPNIKNI
jgi:hypothetical protein